MRRRWARVPPSPRTIVEVGERARRRRICAARREAYKSNALILYIKGDWLEFQKTLGLPAWNSVYNPCPVGDSSFSDLHACYAGGGCRCRERSHDDYYDECDKCERHVEVRCEDLREKIWSKLSDIKTRKEHGFILTEDVPEADLKRGDRLDPSHGLPDIRKLRTKQIPFTATFWRTTRDWDKRITDHIIHHCPLFSRKLETSPARSLALDSLHTVYLGPIVRWNSAALWRIIVKLAVKYKGDQKARRAMALRRIVLDLKKIPK